MLEKNFSRLGIEIKTCMRVDTLKQCLEEQEADVLFIDERLADGSGVEFCMAAAGKYPGMLKIIMADYMTRELAEAKKRELLITVWKSRFRIRYFWRQYANVWISDR